MLSLCGRAWGQLPSGLELAILGMAVVRLGLHSQNAWILGLYSGLGSPGRGIRDDRTGYGHQR